MGIYTGEETPEERERRKAILRSKLRPGVQIPPEFEEEEETDEKPSGRHRKGKGKHAK